MLGGADGGRDPGSDSGGNGARSRGRRAVLLLCATGYAVTVVGFVLAYLLLNPIGAILYAAIPWPQALQSPAAAALIVGSRLLVAALLGAGLVVTDLAVTRRLADVPRTNRRATAGWIAFATALAWVPLAFALLHTIGVGIFPLVLLDHPLAALIVLVPLGLVIIIGGGIGYYAPIGVAVDGRGLLASLGGGWSRILSHPLLAVRAVATLVLGWVLGGVILLGGLLLFLLAIATAWVGLGFLILPVAVAVCLLSVAPLAICHVGYRRATLRA